MEQQLKFVMNRTEQPIDLLIHANGTPHSFKPISIEEKEKSKFDPYPYIDPEKLHLGPTHSTETEMLVRLKCRVCGLEMTSEELADAFMFLLATIDIQDKEIDSFHNLLRDNHMR